MPVSRNSGINHRKKGETIKSLDKFLQEIDEGDWAVISSATDYPENWVIPEHSHNKHQLLYAIGGVMVVYSALNQWTVPPNRGFWMPCGQVHSLRCVGTLKMRSVFVRPDSFPNLPAEPKTVTVSPLLSELIKASVSLKPPYAEDSRDTRIMHLILDELAILPDLPLSLPQPADPRLSQICLALQDEPGDASTVADWSARLGLDQTTIQRLFRKETGMTFGQWRQQARLLLALERIAVGQKIIDVAFELGYESPSAFTSMFKKQFGKTPSHFFR
ncbi:MULTISPECIES: AraC family transcriptional regulator [Pseudomonas]|uniref:AraC family transcriptional regulator n=1 Tax=Pseudomonas synxantha TaxID=47883 RepID=A0A5D3G8H8_9PSED|nr:MULTISPECIES: helix-turn-helix transcriptional regulator [Pseudomonas]KFF47378.1 AraC family transcriptional regulator [Pseudomonas sp. BRG-100]MBY8973401.1 helix-turn-helix transcriptional regulator [Pseudomonas sp. P867]MCK3828978.1 AraC family transcriptional regulator [Pseudomonas sp. W2Aug9]MCK3832917.1 AraC family transcriptional regulator [Pseudomonas fluorescens]MCK3838682.1 AraC family transcriptional regulator [Pseudomonas sp. NCIMB 10586]